MAASTSVLLAAHLRRLTIASLVVGAALAGSAALGGPFWASCASVGAGWSIVNLAIVVASRAGKPAESLAKLREFLFLNQGLNCGYIGVGIALMSASALAGVRGAGLAVIVQGALLFALDAVLLRSADTGSLAVS